MVKSLKLAPSDRIGRLWTPQAPASGHVARDGVDPGDDSLRRVFFRGPQSESLEPGNGSSGHHPVPDDSYRQALRPYQYQSLPQYMDFIRDQVNQVNVSRFVVSIETP